MTFNDVYQGRPINLSGTAEAVVSTGGVDNYLGADQHTFALLEDQSKLTVNGGGLIGATSSGVSGEAMIAVLDEADLKLEVVNIEDSTQAVLAVRNSASALIDGCTITNSKSPIVIGNTGYVMLLNSEIVDATTAAVSFDSGTPEIEIQDSAIVGSAGPALNSAIYSDGLPTITMEESTLEDNASAIYSNYSATITLDNCDLLNNGAASGWAIDLNETQVHHLYLRGTIVTGHPSGGIQAVGAAGSTFDFGRGNSLGNNTFTGNDTNDSGQANMVIQVAANVTVYAAGNTWEPDVQDAAPLGSVNPLPGQYAPDGETWDVIGAASGQNFIISGADAATTTLRLAELPCVPTSSCP
jgi:hypothetical protein